MSLSIVDSVLIKRPCEVSAITSQEEALMDSKIMKCSENELCPVEIVHSTTINIETINSLRSEAVDVVLDEGTLTIPENDISFATSHEEEPKLTTESSANEKISPSIMMKKAKSKKVWMQFDGVSRSTRVGSEYQAEI